MIDPFELERTLQIVLSLVVLLAPLPFLLTIVGAAIWAARHGGSVGPRLSALVAFVGGATVGTFLLIDADVLVLVVVAVPLYIAWNRWRSGRRAQAGWLVAGIALPFTVLWTFYVLLLVAGLVPFTPLPTIGTWLAGAVPFVIGLVVALRGDPPPPPPSISAPVGQPGSREFGSIAAALRETTTIGPFGLPEIAMLVTFIVVSVAASIVLLSAPAPIRVGVTALLVAVLGTEAYIRTMPTRARRAFEAFSWLGEWELERARAWTGRPVPTNKAAATRWLAERPERMEEAPLRVEVLAFVDRLDEARDLVSRMPKATPWEAFEVAALRDLVDWKAGGEGDLPGMEAAAAEIRPPDGDERLRADVTIAVAKVRRLMEAGVGGARDAITPFLDVRDRLGKRGDGQVGRAYRPRVIPLIFVLSLILGVVGELLFSSGSRFF